MEISIFAKKRTTKEGKSFYQYISTLTKRDGTTNTVRVAFRDCDPPKADSCPRNIVVYRENSNLAVRRYTDPNTGEIKEASTLWVYHWDEGSEYIDHSLDDYNFD